MLQHTRAMDCPEMTYVGRSQRVGSEGEVEWERGGRERGNAVASEERTRSGRDSEGNRRGGEEERRRGGAEEGKEGGEEGRRRRRGGEGGRRGKGEVVSCKQGRTKPSRVGLTFSRGGLTSSRGGLTSSGVAIGPFSLASEQCKAYE
eukprot:407326-Rhodomonas_salina.1